MENSIIIMLLFRAYGDNIPSPAPGVSFITVQVQNIPGTK